MAKRIQRTVPLATCTIAVRRDHLSGNHIQQFGTDGRFPGRRLRLQGGVFVMVSREHDTGAALLVL